LLLIVTFTVLYFRYSDAKAENRLDGGIDPAWLTAERERDAVIANAAEPGAAGQRHPS
jgi:arabinofuranan 3-O-arabinosyltransferase